MIIDIVLIHPGGELGIYGKLIEEIAKEPPLWCRLIAGYLLDKGWKVSIIDQAAESLSPADVARRVDKVAPCLVAIVVAGHQPSASTQTMPAAREVAQAIKLRRPGQIIAMLGNHPSALSEKTLREEPVDYVIDGEGPITLDKLLEIIKEELIRHRNYLEMIPGLAWDDCGITRHNSLAPLLDLDRDLHGRAWHLLPPPSAYRAHSWQCLDDLSQRRPYAAIYTSLSCPFACSFCMIQSIFHSHEYRRRSPAAVVEEIVWLYRKHDVRTFKIIDELFVLNKNHYHAICQGIVDAGIGGELNIWAYARTDTVSPADLPLLRAAGVRWLALGIEAGAASVRAGANKALRGDRAAPEADPNGKIKAIVAAIRAADINVIGNYIFGLPGDTLETMQQTLDLSLELNTEFVNYYCAQAYPGSALYDEVARNRPQDLPPSWSAYSQHNRYTYPLRTEALSPADIVRFRDAAFNTYYESSAWCKMARKRFGQAALDHVDAMLAHRLERDLLKEVAA